MHCELLGGVNKSQASQAEMPDFQWVRDDDPLGSNILNISGEMIPSLANYDATPCQTKVIGEYVEEGREKTHLNDMSRKKVCRGETIHHVVHSGFRSVAANLAVLCPRF